MSPKINYKSLDELVYKRIKATILNNELKPGTKIIQHELAEELAVSRTPVYRALTQLAKEHLVKIIPRGGTYVREFSKEELITIFEMREVLEGLACRKAVLVVSKNRLNFFKDLYQRAMKSADKGDWTAYKKADEKFHSFLIETSRIDLLREIVKSFHILSNSYTRGLIRPPQETFPEHMAIIDALKDHDPDLSEKLMREHTTKSIRVLREEFTSLQDRK
ncbi:MAG: GntR family transcriptional regulator [bacterium]